MTGSYVGDRDDKQLHVRHADQNSDVTVVATNNLSGTFFSFSLVPRRVEQQSLPHPAYALT